jgi:hypothetical protein
MTDTTPERLHIDAFLRASAHYLGVPYRPLPGTGAPSLCRSPVGHPQMRLTATPPRMMPAQP